MLLIKLYRKSDIPLYRQIIIQLEEIIKHGTLSEGDILPSSRQLAGQLGVNRTTITKAYDELWASGYIESQSGSYTRVRSIAHLNISKEKNGSVKSNWEKRFTNLTDGDIFTEWKDMAFRKNSGRIDFLSLSPDPQLMPVESFRKTISRTMANKKAEVLNYGSSTGYRPLRQEIVRHMHLHGVDVDLDEVILTNGILHAIDLCLRMITKPGDHMIVERPTFAEIISLMKHHQLDPVEIPMKETGMDLELLEEKILKYAPALIYTMPNFHNPTGITTCQSHREKLICLAEKYDIPVIEDGFAEDMKYFGKQILPLKAIDSKGLVIYTGTFSKFLFPGIRTGWIIANKSCVKQLSTMIRSFDISGNLLMQASLAEFYKTRELEVHLMRAHKAYKKRMSKTLSLCRSLFHSAHVSYTKPMGGYSIWFTVTGRKENELISSFYNHGVLVAPGSWFFASGNDQTCFRISIAHRNEDEIEKGLKIISEII